MPGFGVYPSGVSPFGLSTPLPAGDRATGAAGSRYINPATRDYEQDPTTGQLAQMPTTRQRVVLAILTLVKSSTVYGKFGIKLPRKMGTFFVTEMTQAVRGALKHLTDEGAIRIDSIEVERGASSRSRTTISFTPLDTGVPDTVTF